MALSFAHTVSERFFRRLRDGNGQWLPLVGGRRDERTVTIDWQINRLGYERYSLGTTTRSFLIDHHAALGYGSLSFEGGTNTHSIFHSFRRHTVYNLAARRKSMRPRYLERLLLRFFLASSSRGRWSSRGEYGCRPGRIEIRPAFPLSQG